MRMWTWLLWCQPSVAQGVTTHFLATLTIVFLPSRSSAQGCGASVEKPTDDGDAKVTSNEPVKQKEAPEEKPQEKPVPPAPAPPAAPAAPPKEEHAPAAAAAAPKAPEAPEAEKSAEAPVAHPSESHTGGADWVTSRGTEVQARDSSWRASQRCLAAHVEM